MNILNKKNDNGEENLERPQELRILEKNLENELSTWNTKIDVEINPPNIEDIFKVGTSVWVDDGIRTDIHRKGHGLQRALIFALIKAWANLLKEEKEKSSLQVIDSNTEEQIKTRRKASNSSYFIFEEPELYLHPQAQRELFSSLLNLTKSNNQVILCTHSSSFIDLNFYKSICIVKKNNLSEGTTVFQCTEELFSENEEKKNFNMSYWINPDRSELFFAQKVILVEGAAEKTVIPNLAHRFHIFRYNYTLVDCGSKSSIPIYINLLNKFSIPYTSVYDRDHQSYKTPDAINCADIDSQKIENIINTTIGNSVIFENDIEEEIGITDRNNKNKPYLALKTIEDTNFNITATLKGKIEAIYS